MVPFFNSPRRQLAAAHRILAHVAESCDVPLAVRLWDGSVVLLGGVVPAQVTIAIRSPGVIGSLIRRPTLDNMVRQYATGGIDFEGGDLIKVAETLRGPGRKPKFRNLNKRLLLSSVLPFLCVPAEREQVRHTYDGDCDGLNPEHRDNRDYIQFHYDIGNDFYKLFLDSEMLYSCGYFTDWGNSLEQAQQDKLDMICRKLRLQSGEKFLDIGCGWGGLICHAAERYGVEAHGVTLAQTQFDHVREKIRQRGLEGRVTVELKDYRDVAGTFDKIASIGMFEHVGIANMPDYFGKIYSLLRDRGVVLNHGIARRAKASAKGFRKRRPEHQLIAKYIFPGGELDHIGHTLDSLEAKKFEVHDVEGWREHYAMTTRHWCQRLSAHRDEAIRQVGIERYRLWVAYLAGVSFAFRDGTLQIFQVVASKHAAKGCSEMPPTRSDLYRDSAARLRKVA
ncbi:MAG: class I SAM-dependent methyltransferase [Planctomycetales bacterium]|nr:class I SAM-dependent methyltransferase [Planctomycetales bacterium]